MDECAICGHEERPDDLERCEECGQLVCEMCIGNDSANIGLRVCEDCDERL